MVRAAIAAASSSSCPSNDRYREIAFVDGSDRVETRLIGTMNINLIEEAPAKTRAE